MSTDADSIYDRVNEVLCCARQGMTPLETATLLDLDEADVLQILRDPLLYQQIHGLKGHGSPRDMYMPLPEDIAAQSAIERAASIAAKVTSGPKAHGNYGADYERPVYPRHPRGRRRGS